MQDIGYKTNHESWIVDVVSYFVILIILGLTLFQTDSFSQTIDDRVNEISNKLMCPICQGQSVGESNSDLAKDMRDVIRNKLEQGKSEEEITAFFINRYGESILGAPPPKGINWLLWLMPAFVIAFGGIAIGFFLYKSKEDLDRTTNQSIQSSNKAGHEYLEKIDEELKKFDS